MELDLERHFAAFEENRIGDDDLLATLTKEDPKEIGILPLGARRRNPDYVSAEVGKAERSAMMRLYL